MSRVVFLVRNIAPDKYGGGESYQIELAEVMKKHGFLPIIITASDRLLKEAGERKLKTIRAPYLKLQNYSGVKILLLPIYAVWQIKLYFWFRKQIIKYRPETMNVESRDEWIAATKAGKKLGVNILWTDHIDFRTWVFTNVNKKYKNPIGKQILKCAKLANEIILISDFERKAVEKMIAPRKLNNLVTIKNGVVDCYEQYRDVKVKRRSFGYVGRLVDYKGIRELIKAFKIVAEQEPSARLNIYGDGDAMDVYREMSCEVSGVKFYGYTNKPLQAIADNEVFVLPSYYEGLSMSLISAIMLGKEVIATDVDGNPEIITQRETGLLVEPKNAQELAQAMLFMLRYESEARKMAHAARLKYEKDFDFDKIFAEKMLPLYNIGKE